VSPDFGVNLADALTAAQVGLGRLRQLIGPTHRIHGIHVRPLAGLPFDPRGWVKYGSSGHGSRRSGAWASEVVGFRRIEER
jgi:hypothetical protein